VVGAGSTYTPELVSRVSELPVTELALQDIDHDRLDIVGGLAKRMLAKAGYAGGLTLTGDLDAALDGASFVLVQIRVGGQQARLHDETVPLRCGCIGQETTGAGGFAKAMRTVPVVLELAERASERAAPGAWIVDFTNPVGIVTRALLDQGHRAIGLCNVAIGFQRRFAKALGIAPERVLIDQVGLNHLTWIRAVHIDGEDRLDDILTNYGDEIAADLELPRRLLDDLGAIPSYYLRYFYAHDAVVESLRGAETRAQAVARLEAELLELYADPELCTKPPQLAQRGGAWYSEAAVDLLVSLTGDRRDTQVVNTFNHGTLPFLPDDAVIEVPAVIGAGGADPVPVAPVQPLLRGLIAHAYAYEELALDAALHGGRDRVYDALLAHPLVGQADQAECLTDRLLAENARFLSWT
ncbi:MAG TPA: 6-phospho-beta-glucosidase, partial [Streptosporangiaceae bacterium]|nr:6-phospho-beta-glucosidase [Streptosporangiaceae bacterium]